MRYFLLVLSILLISVTSSSAQFTEGFNSTDKGSYADGTATLPSGSWFFGESLMGNLEADHKFGSHAVRMGNALPSDGSRVQMQFDVPGAGQVHFYYGTYTTDANNGRHSTIQLQQSVDGGSAWTNVGDPLTTSETFTLASFNIDYESDIRFRIVKLTGGTPGGSRNHRVNIDDFTVTEYLEPSQDPRLAVMIDGVDTSDLSAITYEFPQSSQDDGKSVIISVTNTGQETLSVSSQLSGSSAFSLANGSPFDLDFSETHDIEIEFDAATIGSHSGTLLLQSNDPAHPSVSIQLSADVIMAGTPVSISAARSLPFGTIVTVAGWVSTANEFEGPIYIQDETAGIAVFYNPIHTAVQRGDSVVVTGPISEFNPINGTPGTFLRQITGDNVQFSIHPEGFTFLEPRIITFDEMNSGCCESELVLVEDVEFHAVGVFPSNTTNYTTTQYGTPGLVRIDTRSNFTGAVIPVGPTNIVGFVDRFSGDYQLKPRDLDDLGVEEYEVPWADVPLNETFDVATWNIEWFGDVNNGPSNNELQFSNVRRVIETMDMDLYALQEISNVNMFHRLADSLANYNGFIAAYGQTQKVAYLYKKSVIDSLSSGFVATGSTWAGGRFPFMFEFDATVGGTTKTIRTVNFHAKAFATQSDYNQRVADAAVLKQYTDARTNQQDKIIILGDYNDDVTTSTWNNAVSPYQNFVDDPRYEVLTKSLSEMGFTSYRSVSMIDHIMINEHLYEEHLSGSQQVENVSYIGSYLSTTSDHYPVWTRFRLSTDVSISDPDPSIPQFITLEQNYPNPFNPSTVIGFGLPTADVVTLEVFDVTGRMVTRLINNESLQSGQHRAIFDASALTSGMYIYRLTTGSGYNLSGKMMLIK